MKKKWLLLVFVLLLLLAMLLVVAKNAVQSSVSVTFLCYTNLDTRGSTDQYTWAWFRIENRSPFFLSCLQGPLDVERAGTWLQETNQLGQKYEPIIEPGQTLTVSLMPPAGNPMA